MTDTLEIDNATAEMKKSICITATFTAEPVADALNYWIKELDYPFEIDFAPYNQVFQQLLDPASLISQNDEQGINVILLRFEDWRRNLESADSDELFARNLADLENALSDLAQRARTACLIMACPASPAELAGAGRSEMYASLEQRLGNAVAANSLVHFVPSTELTRYYPVREYYDAQTDGLGHIPYTPAMYAAIGSLIARKIVSWRSAPAKVIVLDCDNTLWQGICGEDGPAGVTISAPYQALQKFILVQLSAGMLLCLCSKNEEADVWAVFESRPEMQLKRQQLVSWRINWQPKSENLKSLAAELGLGLDSFIFIDDNPLECAEVQANCADVLTLQLPDEPHNIPSFLEHVWAFDKWRLTAEDSQRTELYKQNIAREQLRAKTLTFHEFLTGLDLKVEIAGLAASQLARVAQLTERTNQFNFTTLRRTESELQSLCLSGDKTCLVVQVSDRFGDYGLVGVIIFGESPTAIVVDTFLMSCRVLGRGVEQRMLARLGEIAKEQGLEYVEASYIPTAKNRPALAFLQAGEQFSHPLGSGFLFKFPAEWAAAAQDRFARSIATAPQPAAEDKPVAAATFVVARNRLESEGINRIARELFDAEHILKAILSQERQRSKHSSIFVAPCTPVEKMLAGMWEQVLGIEPVGIHDNFFESGGDSLLAMRLVAKTHQAGLPFTPEDFSRYQTIAELAARSESTAISQPEQGPVTGLLPLTVAQGWFFSQGFHYPDYWNMAKLVEVPAGSDPHTFEQIVRCLWEHHDALRTRFVQTEKGWRQTISPADQDGIVPFSRVDFSDLAPGEHTDAIERMAHEMQQSLNIMAGPLMRVVFFDLGQSRRGRLLMILHHLIYDGASSIFFDDFYALFQQISQGEPANLPVKTTPIWKWLERLDAYTRSPELRDESDYWLSLPWEEIRALPVDYPENRENNTWGSAHTVQARLSPEETETLLRKIPHAYGVQVIDVLIAALASTLASWSDSRWSMFDVVDFGRNALPNVADLDLSRTVGWFSMDRHLVLKQEDHGRPEDVLKSTRAQLERIPNRGLGYELLLYGSEEQDTLAKLRQLHGAEIALNYDGNQYSDASRVDAQFTPAYEYPGSLWDVRDRRPYLLDCSAQIADGRLITRWRYSKSLHQQSTIKGLAEDYIHWLQALLARYALSK